MAYFGTKYGRKLSQYDMMKLHILSDIFHTLETGSPMIGGSLEPWKHGPVVKNAYNRVACWAYRYDQTGEQPDRFRLVDQQGNSNRFEPTAPPDEDDFSDTEKAAMQKAWETVIPLLDNWNKCERFFHAPDASFIGCAWANATQAGRDIDWHDIVDCYDRFHQTDHSHIKTLMVI